MNAWNTLKGSVIKAVVVVNVKGSLKYTGAFNNKQIKGVPAFWICHSESNGYDKVFDENNMYFTTIDLLWKKRKKVTTEWKLIKVKAGACGIAARGCGARLRYIWPLVGKNQLPRDTGQCEIQDCHIYLPQVSPGTHLSTSPRGSINSWVICTPTPWAGIQTWAWGFR